MAIVSWPLVARTDLVRAFKPGTNDTREAPLRTLRENGWISKGLNVQTRSGAHASGSVTFFSALNVDAARAARRGDAKAARRIAQEASKLEASTSFLGIAELFAGFSFTTVNAVVQGVLTQGAPRQLEALLRSAGSETARRRQQFGGSAVDPVVVEVVFGTVSRVGENFVELRDAEGQRTRLTRGLAQAAQRDELGDCVALIYDPLGAAEVILSAGPALETQGALPRKGFNPYERTTGAHPLTAQDVALLSRARKPRRLQFPVVIDE